MGPRKQEIVLSLLLALNGSAAYAQTAPRHAVRPERFVIQHALLVEGNGTPASGPVDILIENGLITRIGNIQPAATDTVIDAKKRYVVPGFVNLHGHLHADRGGMPMDRDYVLKLWLACGITTVRNVGDSDTPATLAIRDDPKRVAPRLFVYPMLGRPATPDAARARVKQLKAQGADGIKFLGLHRDIMQAALEEAHAQGLPVAHHTGVEETNAWDDIKFKTRSIEHWYGIPDAALDEGVQGFPPSYNYQNEADRFRYAGHLWREANWEKLGKVFDGMVAAGVAWDPTLTIYEASRDLQRAQNQPWFNGYLHPALEAFFRPNLENHGSYFINWTSTDETYWKENYRIWMRAVREFARRGGLVGIGEDAGYIYQMYGFGYLRNLELHQEAGFPPIKIIEQATLNGARILGQESKFGRVRAGWSADLLIVNGNPLEDFRTLYPVHGNGGIEWTIKQGIPYHVPTLMSEVKQIVDKAKVAQKK